MRKLFNYTSNFSSVITCFRIMNLKLFLLILLPKLEVTQSLKFKIIFENFKIYFKYMFFKNINKNIASSKLDTQT